MNCKKDGQKWLKKDSIKRFLKSRLCLVMALTIVFSSGAAICLSTVHQITVVDEQKKVKLFTVETDPTKILMQAGIKLNDTDAFDFKTNTLNVLRRCSVTMTADGNTKTVNVSKGSTIENALSVGGIELTDHDSISMPLNNVILSDTNVSVDRVEYKTVTKDKIINYDEYLKLLKEGRISEANALKDGMMGKMTYTYKYKMVNGSISSQTIVDQTVKPIPTVPKKNPSAAISANAVKKSPIYSGKVEVGTAVISATGKRVKTISTLVPKTPVALDEKGVPLNYSKKITGKATAYYDYNGSRTATGKKTQPGYIAVNPKQIPYGTKMYIRTPDNRIIYGYASAEDTGGFTKKGRITADLFFNSYDECVDFGVRNIEIYILN